MPGLSCPEILTKIGPTSPKSSRQSGARNVRKQKMGDSEVNNSKTAEDRVILNAGKQMYVCITS